MQIGEAGLFTGECEVALSRPDARGKFEHGDLREGEVGMESARMVWTERNERFERGELPGVKRDIFLQLWDECDIEDHQLPPAATKLPQELHDARRRAAQRARKIIERFYEDYYNRLVAKLVERKII